MEAYGENVETEFFDSGGSTGGEKKRSSSVVRVKQEGIEEAEYSSCGSLRLRPQAKVVVRSWCCPWAVWQEARCLGGARNEWVGRGIRTKKHHGQYDDSVFCKQRFECRLCTCVVRVFRLGVLWW